MDKLCILSFDEMSVDSRIVYNLGVDQILGPCSKVQTVLARGLTSKWKQPIYFQFDTTMNAILLLQIIDAVESSGYTVCGIVSDLGGCNTLWKDLNININNTHFINPKNPNKRVYIFADMPHYLKLLRNHYLDHGIVLEDGTILRTKILVNLLNQDKGELKLCHKLNPMFLQLKGNDRQKVLPAKTIFSRTTAKAIDVLLENKKATKFFEQVDTLCDIMNSSSPYPPSSHPMKAGFGLEPYYNEQRLFLNEMEKVVSGMRVAHKKCMLPFQKGIIISIKSLFGLLDHVRENYNMKYLLTTRLTQDVLESLFSQIRGVGNFYDHPSPSEFIWRLRKILLSNKMLKPSTKSNVLIMDHITEQTYLTSDLLESVFEPEMIKIMTDATQTKEEEEEDTELLLDVGKDKSWAEMEAVNYVAGYIAFKVRDKDPTLGSFSKDVPNSSWIHHLSLGGLTVPTDDWRSTVNQFEEVFESFYGTGKTVNKQKGVIKELISRLSNKFPTVNPEAVRRYARVRTFIRIRYLNEGNQWHRKKLQKAKKWVKSSIDKSLQVTDSTL